MRRRRITLPASRSRSGRSPMPWLRGAVDAGAMSTPVDPASTFERAKPITLALTLVLLGAVGLKLLSDLTHVLLLLFVAVLFASTLSRPAGVLERRGVPRGAAVALVQAAGLAVVVGLLWVVVPPLVEQVGAFSDRLPSYVARVHQLRGRYDVVRRHYPELGSFDDESSGLAGRIGGGVGDRLVNLPTTSAQILADLTTIYVLASLMVMRRERMLSALLVVVTPAYRDATRRVMEKVW